MRTPFIRPYVYPGAGEDVAAVIDGYVANFEALLAWAEKEVAAVVEAAGKKKPEHELEFDHYVQLPPGDDPTYAATALRILDEITTALGKGIPYNVGFRILSKSEWLFVRSGGEEGKA